MPARRLLLRKIPEVLRLKHEQGLSHRAIARACAVGVGTVTLVSSTDGPGRVGLAAAARAGRRDARGPLVPARGPGARPGPARLRVHPPGAQARRRHAAVALGGVRPSPSERLPPHPVLRDLPAVGAAAGAVDAAGPPRRREDVHRLLREAAGAGRSPYGRIPPGRAVRRRPRRQQPDLRRGDRDPAVARLGRRPHSHGRVLRRHDRLVGPPPAQERHHPPLPLRAGGQSHQRGPRRPLRRRVAAGRAARMAVMGLAARPGRGVPAVHDVHGTPADRRIRGWRAGPEPVGAGSPGRSRHLRGPRRTPASGSCAGSEPAPRHCTRRRRRGELAWPQGGRLGCHFHRCTLVNTTSLAGISNSRFEPMGGN